MNNSTKIIKKWIFRIILLSLGTVSLVTLILKDTLLSDLQQYVREHIRGVTWQTRYIPAMRGRILDSEGHALAWSIRSFSLWYYNTENTEIVQTDMAKLNAFLQVKNKPHFDHNVIGPHLLKGSLTPDELISLEPFTRDHERFKITSHFIRRYIDHEVRSLVSLGETVIIDHQEVGISGIEKKYHHMLTGQPAKYRVMVDRHGNWLTETWQEIQPAIPGFDVYIDIPQQILAQNQ